MQTENESQMISEFMAGTPVPLIAERYNVPEAYVDRVIEETSFTGKPKRSWSINLLGNRVVYSIVIGWLAWAATFKINIWVFVLAGALFFAATSVIASRRRT